MSLPKEARSVLEKILGKEFIETFEKAMLKAQEISPEKCEELCKEALDLFKSSGNSVVKLSNGLDAIIAIAPNKGDQFIKKASTGRYKVAMIFINKEAIEKGLPIRGPWISIFVPSKEDAVKLLEQPNRSWIIIGKFRERTFEGAVTWSMNAMCFRPLDEVELTKLEDEGSQEELEEIKEEVEDENVNELIQYLKKNGRVAIMDKNLREKVIKRLEEEGIKFEVVNDIVIQLVEGGDNE